jgi:bis(5'-nucleosidyl)-tetraphosphatase
MQKVKSCGVIVMRFSRGDATRTTYVAQATHTHSNLELPSNLSFLLMHKPKRYDLPKGHMEHNEDELSCALRELREETGILASDLDIDTNFRFVDTYKACYQRFGRQVVEKNVIIFLGWLKHEVNIKLSEHSGYTWVDWNPPHIIQNRTINPLLRELAEYLDKNSGL